MGTSGFAERIKNFFGLRTQVSDEFFDDLADLLVEGDFGAAQAFKTVDELRSVCKKEKISENDGVRQRLAVLLEAGLCPAPTFVPPDSALTVILLLGVNGVGKTTTAAKLSDLYRRQYNKRPILAAADTFRAAAIDQLKIHGERLGVRVVAHKHGGDPAAVVYDAIEAARAGGGDLIIADTAGRMHTKTALVEELKKIDRVVESRAPGSVYIRYLVLDATTGRNALAQAETFHQAVPLDGVILTKFDSSARGGAAFSLSAELSLPVIFVCNGESYGDIKPFDPREYTKEFIGIE
ncbi:signal recognition particle-docking protein FtsY [Treponema primitia ZAS-2]|uniref:Signal recognition particle receptor FtsY n=1 Tax=Treponema primitia (strain ATCC BAA-887 / DSM 12427 / ZAS-2) TaxID=545694 RepID=F5YM19_TREPZ|nr:signal recognition particle-docking protein FtsY [Treponema primitia]AEF84366.1 signal recognition particle-docking protein FtsY [Treponema primitia ZAS-2]